MPSVVWRPTGTGLRRGEQQTLVTPRAALGRAFQRAQRTIRILTLREFCDLRVRFRTKRDFFLASALAGDYNSIVLGRTCDWAFG
jgi:hypothetical protein